MKKREQIAALQQQVTDLEQRVAALEQRLTPYYGMATADSTRIVLTPWEEPSGILTVQTVCPDCLTQQITDLARRRRVQALLDAVCSISSGASHTWLTRRYGRPPTADEQELVAAIKVFVVGQLGDRDWRAILTDWLDPAEVTERV